MRSLLTLGRIEAVRLTRLSMATPSTSSARPSFTRWEPSLRADQTTQVGGHFPPGAHITEWDQRIGCDRDFKADRGLSGERIGMIAAQGKPQHCFPVNRMLPRRQARRLHAAREQEQLSDLTSGTGAQLNPACKGADGCSRARLSLISE